MVVCEWQIGNGSLYVIAELLSKDRPNTVIAQPLPTKNIRLLSWFKIAHLDKDKQTIDGQVISFEGPKAPKIASSLSINLERTAYGIQASPTHLENDVKINLLKSGDISIVHGDAEVIVTHDDAPAFVDKLTYIGGFQSVPAQDPQPKTQSDTIS